MESQQEKHINVAEEKIDYLAQVEHATAEEHKETVWKVITQHPRVAFWCLFYALSAIGWGFDAQVNGGALSIASFRSTFGYIYEGEPVLQASWQSAFNSVSSIGQFFGGFACSWLSDRIGRKLSLTIGLVFVTAGIFGEVFATANVAFLIGKMILGIGLGFYLTIGPLCAAELAPVSLRGVVTAGTNLGICIGQLLSNAAIKGFGERDDTWAYRAPFSLQWLFVVFIAVGLPWAPESPWYHVRKNQMEQAKRCLFKLYGTSTDIDAKLAMMVETVNEDIEATSAARWVQCFQGTNLIRTMISVMVFACQHLSGIVFVLGFSTYFFQLAGIDESDSFNLGVGVTAVGVLGCLISWSLINNFGRRKLFIVGMIGMTVVLLLMGILDVVHSSAARWVQASCTVIYALFYQATIGPLAFAILGETPTASLRAKTVGLATAMQAVFGTLMNVVVPYLVNPDKANLRGKVGFIFGGLCAFGTVWSWFFVPELKGRTFAEIDHLFQNHVSPRRMASYQMPVGRAVV